MVPTMRVLSTFLFPDSPGLRTRWWHRLAVVGVWCWISYIILAFLKAVILDPHASCTAVKYSQYSDGSLDCGNIFSYAFRTLSESSAGEIAFTSALVIFVGYIAVLIPSLSYRVVLYIATGGAWKKIGTKND